MNKTIEKHVQSHLSVNTYLKIREYAILHSMSLSCVIKLAVEEFIEEKNKNVSKEIG